MKLLYCRQRHNCRNVTRAPDDVHPKIIEATFYNLWFIAMIHWPPDMFSDRPIVCRADARLFSAVGP